MSPSCRSSAARSASTLRCARCRTELAPAPCLARLARSSAWRTDRPLAMISRGQRFGVGRRRNGARVAHADIASHQRLPHRLRKIEQSQQVGDVAARLVDDLADLVLGVAIAVDQLADSPRPPRSRSDPRAGYSRSARSRRVAASSMSRTIAGIACSCARCAARQRRSPAMIWKPSPSGRSRIGWSTPRSAIEFGELVERLFVEMHAAAGRGLGRIRAISISRTPPRRVAVPSGVRRGASPSSAERPMPEPLRRTLVAHAASASCGQARRSARAPGAI